MTGSEEIEAEAETKRRKISEWRGMEWVLNDFRMCNERSTEIRGKAVDKEETGDTHELSSICWDDLTD